MDAHTKAQAEMLTELLGPQEELDPDLEQWLDQDGPFGPCIKHPLVFNIVHTPMQNAMVNRQYRGKMEATEKALAAGNWEWYVWLYERPYRLDAFAHISWHLNGPDYWGLLGRLWSDTENAWQSLDKWREFLTADPEGREMMSTEEARCAFTLPPEQGGLLPMTRVYRGYCHDGAEEGFSWTLDRARARWFARRLWEDGDPVARIVSGLVAKEHVLAHITSRDEQEIVCLPEHVVERTVEEA